MFPVGILRPAAETPVCHRNFVVAGIAAHKDRPGIARPATIRWPEMKLHPLQAYMTAIEDGAHRIALGGVEHDDVHIFDPAQMSNDVGVYPRDRLEFSRPVILIVRPCKPCPLLPFPLRPYAVAVLARRQVFK